MNSPCYQVCVLLCLERWVWVVVVVSELRWKVHTSPSRPWKKIYCVRRVPELLSFVPAALQMWCVCFSYEEVFLLPAAQYEMILK